MNQLASAILEPNLERSLLRIESLTDAQTALSNQLDALNATAQANTEPLPGDEAILEQAQRLKKRINALNITLENLHQRVQQVRERTSAISQHQS